MEITELKYFKNRRDWRAWLKKYHAKKKEIWILFYKKHTGKPCISLNDAVEEALCYGWIDTTLKRIDGEKHAVRVTPRRKGSVWSDINKDRVKKLMKQGLMTKAGLETIKGVDLDAREAKLSRMRLLVPPDFKKAMAGNEKAADGFASLAPSSKKIYLFWIKDAKKAKTRQRRIDRAVIAAEKRFIYPFMK